MSLYQAPLADMRLLVEHALQKTGVAELPELAAFDTELVGAVLDEAAKLAQGELAPLNQSGDVEGCRFEDGQVITPNGWQQAYNHFCEGGWMGLALPEAYGGQGLPRFIAQPVHEMWLSSNLAFVLFHALTQGGSEILLHFGSEAQKARYLEPMVSGRWGVAMSLTEPNAGSDLGAITTKATLQDDGTYLIKGQKIFITYGEHDLTENIIHLVLARTPDAPAGSRGLSLFLVPKKRVDAAGQCGADNDVRCTGIEHKLGLHGSPTCSISYGEQDACFGELLGQENRGLEAMFVLMNEARLSTGLQGVAVGEVGYQRALEYALERTQGNHFADGKQRVAIAEHPDVARMLLSIRAQVMGLRAVGYLIAALIDKADFTEDADERARLQGRIALLTPIFKAFTTEAGNQMAGTTVQIFGGMGFVEETGVAQLLRDIRITTIYEGTTGVQARDLLFRKIRADRGQALSLLLDEIAADCQRCAGQPGLASAAASLNTTLVQLRDLLPALCETDNLLQLHAGSVPLLEALGTLCCGWQLLDVATTAQSTAAQQRIAAQDSDNLQALAQFYAAHQVPQIAARLATFTQADAGLAGYRFTL